MNIEENNATPKEPEIPWGNKSRASRHQMNQFNKTQLSTMEVENSIDSIRLLREIDRERYRQKKSIYNKKQGDKE